MRRSPLLVALALLASCGDSTGPNVTLANLTGTWVLTGYELQEVGNPANHLSFYDQGLRGTIVIQADGQFSFQVTAPGEDPQTLDGVLQISGDSLFYSEATGYQSKFRVSLAGSTMHWAELESQSEEDLDGDGNLEDVITILDWRRQ